MSTFCQIDPRLAAVPADGAASNDSDFDQVSDAEGEFDEDVPRNTSRAQSHFRGDDVVSRSEHNALMERVAALERMFQPEIPQATPRTMPNQHETMSHAMMSSSATTAHPQAQAMGHYTFDGGPQRHNTQGRGVSGEPRVMGAAHRQPVDYRDQVGFNMDTDRVMADYHPSVSRRSDSMSTVRRTSPVTTTHQHYDSLDGQPKPTASDSAYGTASNAGPTQRGDAANMATQQGIQMGGGGGGEDDYGQEGISQASSNTRLINQFIQAEEQREAVMSRASFFNPDTDDLSNFLNMESQ